jgi:DNA-binding response OmpR family regulator
MSTARTQGQEAAPRRAPLVALIDDEEDITTYLALALEDAGYRVVTCNDSAVAVELLAEEPPDLVCLDLLMPRRMGPSLYRLIREHAVLGRIPVIILTGLGAEEDLEELLHVENDRLPPSGYLDKPVDARGFLGLVERVLHEEHGP